MYKFLIKGGWNIMYTFSDSYRKCRNYIPIQNFLANCIKQT